MKSFLITVVLFYIKLCAKAALKIHKPITIGIAGSVGKSSARNAIFSVLKEQSSTRLVYGNSETGVPLGILGIEIENYSFISWIKTLLSCPFKIFSTLHFKYMVVEMGIDDPYPPKNMEYLLSIIRPDIAISLNVSATHTQQFQKLINDKSKEKDAHEFLLERIAAEDTKIITASGCRVGIYNSDDLYISHALAKFSGKLLDFGEKSKDIKYDEYHVDTRGTTFNFTVGTQNIQVFQNGQILPIEYREIFAAALLTAFVLKIDLIAAAKSLTQNFRLPRGRGSIFRGKKKSLIIDSTYNASGKSTLAYLDLLLELKLQTNKKAVFIMGDMRELGDMTAVEHKKVAERINDAVDYLYCVGPLTYKHIMPAISGNIISKWFKTSPEAGKFLSKNLPGTTIILVKGSQNEIYLEETVKMLLSNPKDSVKLCRQNQYWQRIKKEFFASTNT